MPTGAGQAPPGQPVFKSGVEYVAVDVVVTDKRDRPVMNLQAGDFEILEGRPSAGHS